jgi:hypothetical protein
MVAELGESITAVVQGAKEAMVAQEVAVLDLIRPKETTALEPLIKVIMDL